MAPRRASRLSKTNNIHQAMRAPFVNIGLRRNIIRNSQTKNRGNKTLVIARPIMNPQLYADGPSFTAIKLAVKYVNTILISSITPALILIALFLVCFGI